MPDETAQRKTYVLSNLKEEDNKITDLKDSTKMELIDINNFTIKEVPIDDIEPGQWFVFVEETSCSGTPCVSVTDNGVFVYLCVKNNKNGSIDVKTTFFDFEQKIKLIGKINQMIKEIEEQ